MKDTRQAVRGISLFDGGKHTVVVDPDAIAGMYSQGELDAFIDAGVLKSDVPGEWVSMKIEKEVAPEPSEFTPLSLDETIERMTSFDFSDEVIKSMSVHKDQLSGAIQAKLNADESDLPDNFPLRKRLVAQGVTTLEKVKAMDRAALVGLNYVTEENVDSILNYGKE